MKITKLFTFTFMLGALLMLGAVKASAQAGIAPSSQLGIGAFAGGTSAGGGATIQYAFTPAFQLGLALGVYGVSVSGASTTNYSTEVYGRFLFEGAVNPFVQVSFGHSSEDVSNGAGATTTSTSNHLAAAGGLEYFFNRNVGVNAMVNIISIGFDPSVTTYGFNSGRVGVEWFFNP